jgi:hypothetical protein
LNSCFQAGAGAVTTMIFNQSLFGEKQIMAYWLTESRQKCVTPKVG